MAGPTSVLGGERITAFGQEVVVATNRKFHAVNQQAPLILERLDWPPIYKHRLWAVCQTDI